MSETDSETSMSAAERDSGLDAVAVEQLAAFKRSAYYQVRQR